jgi:O-antigen ligase
VTRVESLGLIAIAILAPVALLPLLAQPELGLALVIAAVALALAWFSPAIPLGLAGMAAWFASMTGITPPDKSVIVILGAWVAAGVVLAAVRKDGTADIPTLAGAPVILALLLCTIMLARIQGSPDALYGQEKLLLFFAQSMLFLVAAIFVARRPRDLEIFLVLMAGVATLAAVVLMIQLAGGLQPVYPGRYSLAGTTDPIELGRQCAAGILICMYALLARGPWQRSLVALVALPLLGVGLLSSGSRGPIIGLAAGTIVLLLLLRHSGGRKIRWPIVAGATVVVAMAASSAVPGQASDRVLALVTGGGAGLSSTGRTDLWALAWQQFETHPLFGLGTGGFAAVAPLDLRYPHNLFFEAASELGIVGLLIIVAIVAIGAYRIVKLAQASRIAPIGPAAVVAALFAASLGNAFFSGDMAANSQLWLSLGLLVGLPELTTRRSAQKAEPRPVAPRAAPAPRRRPSVAWTPDAPGLSTMRPEPEAGR